MKKILFSILILVSTNLLAKGHSGADLMKYSPDGITSEGFNINIKYRWSIETMIGEPLKGLNVEWTYAEKDGMVPVAFRSPQTGEMIKTEAPIEVVKKCHPIIMKLVGKVKDSRGVTIQIDGGVVSKEGESFNIKGSPSWHKLFNDGSNFIRAERAKKIYNDKNFKLSFPSSRAEIEFSLFPLKEWFLKTQLNKRVEVYCEELDKAYLNLSKISNKFPYAVKKAKLNSYCQNKSIYRLKKEVQRMKDQEFIKAYFDQDDVVKAMVEANSSHSKMESKTKGIQDMGGDPERIENAINQEYIAEQDAIETQKRIDEYENEEVTKIEEQAGQTFEIEAQTQMGWQEGSYRDKSYLNCDTLIKKAKRTHARERNGYLEAPDFENTSCERDPENNRYQILKYKWRFLDLTIPQDELWIAKGKLIIRGLVENSFNCQMAYDQLMQIEEKDYGPYHSPVDHSILSNGTWIFAERELEYDPQCECSIMGQFGTNKVYKQCSVKGKLWWNENFVKDQNKLERD